jgi:hypothetical protein
MLIRYGAIPDNNGKEYALILGFRVNGMEGIFQPFYLSILIYRIVGIALLSRCIKQVEIEI